MTQSRPSQVTTLVPDQETRADCLALAQVVNRIGDKWTVMVVGVLSGGPQRFNTILHTIDGVSHRMLTLTLRRLERDGLVTRTVYPTIPPKVEYELTDLGRSLIEPLKALSTWGREHRAAVEDAQARFDALAEASADKVLAER